MADFDGSTSHIACPASLGLPPTVGLWPETTLTGGKIVNRWVRIVGAEILVGTLLPTPLISQTTPTTKTPGPYALIGIMRALDEGHSVDLEAGYVRHLEWHRQANRSIQLVQLFSLGIH
jgi:hypothetical protein